MHTDYRILSEALVMCLNLRQAPVAVCFSAEIPNTLAPFEGSAAAGCRFWQEGMTRTFTTTARDHERCAIGVHTHNLAPSAAQQKDLQDALHVFAALGYVRPEDITQIPVLQQRPERIVYAPLSATPVTPDVVLLFVSPGRALIVSEAVQQVEQGFPQAMGRPACAVVSQVVNSGHAAMSLGCCGARAYLDVLEDDTAIIALPGGTLSAYVSRIEALAKANAVLSEFHRLRRRDIAAGATGDRRFHGERTLLQPAPPWLAGVPVHLA